MSEPKAYTLEQLSEALESWPIDSNDIDDQDLLLQAGAMLRAQAARLERVRHVAENRASDCTGYSHGVVCAAELQTALDTSDGRAADE